MVLQRNVQTQGKPSSRSVPQNKVETKPETQQERECEDICAWEHVCAGLSSAPFGSAHLSAAGWGCLCGRVGVQLCMPAGNNEQPFPFRGTRSL